MNTGYTEIIDADLSKYFDAIPHANLMATVAERICDGEILYLIQMWLKAPIMGGSSGDNLFNSEKISMVPQNNPVPRYCVVTIL